MAAGGFVFQGQSRTSIHYSKFQPSFRLLHTSRIRRSSFTNATNLAADVMVDCSLRSPYAQKLDPLHTISMLLRKLFKTMVRVYTYQSARSQARIANFRQDRVSPAGS